MHEEAKNKRIKRKVGRRRNQTGSIESGAIAKGFRDEARELCATIDRRSNRFDTPTPVPISGCTSYTRTSPIGRCSVRGASFSFRHHLSRFPASHNFPSSLRTRLISGRIYGSIYHACVYKYSLYTKHPIAVISSLKIRCVSYS